MAKENKGCPKQDFNSILCDLHDIAKEERDFCHITIAIALDTIVRQLEAKMDRCKQQ